MRIGLLVLLVGLTPASAAFAEVPLVVRGEARAIVVVPAEFAPVAQYAAEEFVAHLATATGVELPIYAADAAPDQPGARVCIGLAPEARDAGIDVDALDEEAAAILTAGDRLFIIGDDDEGDPLEPDTRAGTLWGVYELLERDLGAVWMFPGDLGAHVPATDTVVIGEWDEQIKPALLQRQVRPGIIERESPFQGFTEEGLEAYREAQRVFLRRHRMGKTYPFHWGHAFSNWWVNYGEQHPEWFQLLDNGRRGPLNETGAWNVSMCVSEPGFHEEIIRQWRERRAANPGAWMNLNICENDCSGRCVCEECQAWDEPLLPEDEGKSVEQRSVSNRYARFWASIYELAAPIDPDVTVTAYAYANYRRPPTADVQLNENILVGFVPYVNFPLTDEMWERVRSEWMGWRETGARLFLRPNSTLVGHAMPYNYARQIAEMMRLVMHNGCVATDFDSLPGQWAAMGSTLYTLCRAHTRPDLDADAMLAEYYSGFGPAADEIREYFDYWERRLNDVILGDSTKRGLLFWASFGAGEHVIYGAEQFEEAGRILDRAEEAAGEGVFGERVGYIRLGWEHAKLCAEISALLAGVDPTASPLAVYDRIDELARFRIAHEGEMFANLAFATLIERNSWKVPDRPRREPLRAVSAEVAEFEGTSAIPVRGGQNFVALLGQGEPFRARIATRQVGNNPAPIGWHLIGPDEAHLDGGALEHGEAIDLEIEVPAPGQYMLMVQTSRNLADVTLLNDHAALVGERIDMLGPGSPLWVWVPEDCERFTVTISSQVPENAHCAIIAPDGSLAAEAETGDEREIPMTVEVPEVHRGAAWQVVISAPSTGIFEDYAVEISEGLPPYWSHTPDRLVVPE
ncbi:MAG: DUF4838 domain-containing protein [Armatimonadota bacterium]|jgi:hypothetical protein